MGQHFDKTFSVDLQVEIEAKNTDDAKRRAIEALREGLIEPGFVVDGYVYENQVFEVDQQDK